MSLKAQVPKGSGELKITHYKMSRFPHIVAVWFTVKLQNIWTRENIAVIILNVVLPWSIASKICRQNSKQCRPWSNCSSLVYTECQYTPKYLGSLQYYCNVTLLCFFITIFLIGSCQKLWYFDLSSETVISSKTIACNFMQSAPTPVDFICSPESVFLFRIGCQIWH